METKEGQLDNEHFHSEAKGCILEQYTTESVRSKTKTHYFSGIIQGQICKTHQKDCCRCGWEWGWHDGTNSKDLNKGQRKSNEGGKWPNEQRAVLVRANLSP